MQILIFSIGFVIASMSGKTGGDLSAVICFFLGFGLIFLSTQVED